MSKVYDDMMNGEIYWPGDEELMKQQLDCMEKLYDYNATRPHEWEKRKKLLKEMLAEVGEDCYIEPPLHANWGGHHLHLGKQVYAKPSAGTGAARERLSVQPAHPHRQERLDWRRCHRRARRHDR